MRAIAYLLIPFLFIACNGQNKDKLKTIPMTTEKFDIEKFKKNLKPAYTYVDGSGNKTLVEAEDSNVEIKLKDGTCINQSGDSKTGYTEYILPSPPAIYGSYKDFYPNGKLKEKIEKTTIGQYMGVLGYLQPILGIVPLADESAQKITYNEKGECIKIDSYSDMMKGLKIQADELFGILEKEKLFDRNKITPELTDLLERYRGGIEIVFHSDHPLQPDVTFDSEYKFKKGDHYWWEVKKKYRPKPIDKEGHDYKQRKVIYKIDAVTGKVEKLKDILLTPEG